MVAIHLMQYSTAELIPGLEVVSTTNGISVPLGTTILTVVGDIITLSNSVTGAGTCQFVTQGADNNSADQGGIRLKEQQTREFTTITQEADKYWVMTENLELAFGKKMVINNQLVLSTTTLGSTVVNSSLTSVGTYWSDC